MWFRDKIYRLRIQSIKSMDTKIIVAGGQENMSLAPHSIHLKRWKKLGDVNITDTMINDGLWDAFHHYHMGMTAENVAEKFQITREDQDKFALNSQEKALSAQKNKFKEEIMNFKIKSKNTELDFNKDEHPRDGISIETLKNLNQFLKKWFSHSRKFFRYKYGAAAVTMMSVDEAEKRGIQKLVTIKS